MLLNPVPILNVESIEPSELSLTIEFFVTEEYVVNDPPTTIFPLDCKYVEFTVPLNPPPILKLLSIEPSEFNLISLRLEVVE